MNLRLIVMFTNVEYREREKENVGDRPAKVNDKKGKKKTPALQTTFTVKTLLIFFEYILEFFINSSPPTSNSVYQQNFMGKTLKIVINNNNNNCASAGVTLAPGLPSLLVSMGNGRYIDFYELFKKVTE